MMMLGMVTKTCGTLFLVAIVLVLNAPRIARADPSSQARQEIQAVCDRSVLSYHRRDLNGCMAMYAPVIQSKNVAGRTSYYRQVFAGFASDFAEDPPIPTLRATVRSVLLHGMTADVVLDWQFTHRHKTFTYVRAYSERAVWVRGSKGWQEIKGQMTRDALVYQKNP